MASRGLRLATNTAVFAAGTVTTQVISLVTVPFVAAHLSTGDYGSVDLLMTIVAIIFPVASLSISEAVIRFGMDDSYSLQQIVSSAFVIAFLGFVACLAAWPVIQQMTNFGELIGFGYAMLFAQIFRDIAAGYLRAANRIKMLVAGGIAQSVLLAAAVIVLMGVRSGGRGGYLAALLVSNLTISLLFTGLALRGGRFSLVSIRRDNLLRMLRFSVPLVPNALMWLTVASVSRFFLLASHGTESVGLYAVAVRITTVLVGMTSVFMQAWQLSAIEERNSTDGGQFESSVFRTLSGGMLVGASALLLAVKPLMKALFAKGYYDAWISVPPLLFGVVWLAFATFTGTQYKVRMATSRALWTSVAGAGAVVALSAMIVPRYGAFGAGLATCGGYAALWVLRVFDVGFPLRSKRWRIVFFLSLGLLGGQAWLLYVGLPEWVGLPVGFIILGALFLLNMSSLRPLWSILSNILQSRKSLTPRVPFSRKK